MRNGFRVRLPRPGKTISVASRSHSLSDTSPYRHLCFDTVASTNDEAMARLRGGDPGGLVVTARTQTAGRGRTGRIWSSPPGNLIASLALRDPGPAAKAPQLGFVAGVALAQALRARLADDQRLRLKWPNDVLHAGAKLAGMLLESSVLPDGALGCVIGIGVNCRSHPDGLAYPTTNMREAGDPEPDSECVLADFLRRFDMQLRFWKGGAGFAPVRLAWLAMAAGLGERIAVATPRHRLDGIFRDLDATGRLLLETADGTIAIEAGDIFFPALAAVTTS